MPVADCATEPTTNGSVRSALDLLLSFEDRQANVGLQITTQDQGRNGILKRIRLW